MTVLHLTDLHFGMESSATATAQRKNALDRLLDILGDLDPSWQPGVVVVSGDLGWRGAESDYTQAETWLNSLLDRLHIDASRLVMCPGNHDVDRSEAEVLARPQAPDRADKLLAVEKLDQINRPFGSYAAFNQSIGGASFTVGAEASDLVGSCVVEETRFVVLNSAWFCRDNDDDRKLFLGLPQLEVMEAAGQFKAPQEGGWTVGVVHHPETWLNEAETNAYEPRPATFDYLCERVDLLLCGHTHSGPRPPRINMGAFVVSGGASYDDGRYRNHVSLLRLGEHGLDRRVIEMDPRGPIWMTLKDTHHPRASGGPPATTEDRSPPTSQEPDLRTPAAQHAIRFVEAKARAVGRPIRPTNGARRFVAVEAEDRGAQREKDHAPTDLPRMPLHEAANREAPSFLLGEMGAGKSTLVGEYVAYLNGILQGPLALLVPAKQFAGRATQSVQSFFAVVNAYVETDIAPGTQVNLADRLHRRDELTLVIDGLDEIAPGTAAALSQAACEAAALHVSLRVIVTGRPIELRGIEYGPWQILRMEPLTRSEQTQLLRAEALADGLSAEDAVADADARLAALAQIPGLRALADTPLTLRLLRRHLSGDVHDQSAGDLIEEVVRSRLGGWDESQGRTQPSEALNAVAVEDHLAALAAVAEEVRQSSDQSIRTLRLTRVVESSMSGAPPASIRAVEAAIRAGFLEGTDVLGFTSQPMYQFAVGYGLYRALRDGGVVPEGVEAGNLWREFAFAASITRARGDIPTLSEAFHTYVDNLLDARAEDGTPSVAAVAAELRDETLARHLVRRFQALSYRPLKQFQDRSTSSSMDYARVLHLAGDEGFDWLYDEYLDPAYPHSDYHDTLETGIVRGLIALHAFKIPEVWVDRLASLTRPHLAARTWCVRSLLPVLAVAIPLPVTADEQARLLASALGDPLLAERAEQALAKMLESEESSRASDALSVAITTNGGNRRALALWAHRNGDHQFRPQAALAQMADPISIGDDVRSQVADELGIRDALPLLRWWAMGEGKTATLAALALFNVGVRDLEWIGPALSSGSKHHSATPGAREALEHLLDESEDSYNWLLDRTARDVKGETVSEVERVALLKALSDLEDPEPHALYYVVRSLGVRTLVHSPLLRHAFKALLTSHKVYKDELGKLMQSYNRTVRLVASQIMLLSDPETESDAMSVALRGVGSMMDQNGWNRFMMRLHYGDSVLDRVEGLIPELLPFQKTLALGILHHNGRTLTAEQKQLAADGLIGEARFIDVDHGLSESSDRFDTILADEKLFDTLVSALEADSGKRGEAAADALLKHHRERLDTNLRARVILLSQRGGWLPGRLLHDLSSESPDVLEAMVDQGKALRATTGKGSTAAPLAALSLDHDAWRDVVWAVALENGIGRAEWRHSGEWLLGVGRRAPAVAAQIGTACADLVRARTGNDEVAPLWVALLAHTFGDLSDAELTAEAQRDVARPDVVVAAIIHRTGNVDALSARERSGHLLAFKSVPKLQVLAEPSDLLDRVRGEGDLTSGLDAVVERALVLGMRPETLAAESKAGALVAAAVTFATDETIPAKWLASALSLHARGPRAQPPQTLANAHSLMLSKARQDDTLSRDLAEQIDQRLRAGTADDLTDSYHWILILRGHLSESDWSAFMNDLVDRSFHLSRGLAHDLAGYFAGWEGEGDAPFLPALRSAGAALSANAGKEYRTDSALLLFLVGLTLITADEDSALGERLYLAGLPELMTQTTHFRSANSTPQPRVEAAAVLNVIFPLVDKAPPPVLARCIHRGARSEDPMIRVCCRILQGVATGSPDG